MPPFNSWSKGTKTTTIWGFCRLVLMLYAPSRLSILCSCLLYVTTTKWALKQRPFRPSDNFGAQRPMSADFLVLYWLLKWVQLWFKVTPFSEVIFFQLFMSTGEDNVQRHLHNCKSLLAFSKIKALKECYLIMQENFNDL